jgi:HPt (histidine-containing phosphotransfer) domain-containing protein
MEALQQRYLDNFPKRLERIRAALAGLRQKPDHIEFQQMFFGEVHKIAGSAGSYGFQALSLLANDWEASIISAKQGQLTVSLAMLEQFDAVVLLLEGYCRSLAAGAQEDEISLPNIFSPITP